MLGLTLKLSAGQQLAVTLTLRQAVGETSGEIPLYSLHRIKRMMNCQPMDISPELRMLLSQNLLSANTKYKEDSGRDWNCLTSANLVDAIEMTDEGIRQGIEGLHALPTEYGNVRDKVLAKLHERRANNIEKIKRWFEHKFDDLVYNTNGDIPWSVVCRLRRDLGYWIATKVNPFGKDIEDLILEVAQETGIATQNPEDAWKRMGGKVFRKR